jgi:hypothetical protein
MLAQYEENYIMQRKVYQWIEWFQTCRTCITDEDCMGSPITLQMTDNVEQVNALVQEDKQITVTDIVNKLDISCRSAYSIIYKDLGYYKICARWVPKRLTDGHKWACVEKFMQLL